MVEILEHCLFGWYVQLTEEVSEDVIEVAMGRLIKRRTNSPDHRKCKDRIELLLPDVFFLFLLYFLVLDKMLKKITKALDILAFLSWQGFSISQRLHLLEAQIDKHFKERNQESKLLVC